jgi:hypothetical protein
MQKGEGEGDGCNDCFKELMFGLELLAYVVLDV